MLGGTPGLFVAGKQAEWSVCARTAMSVCIGSCSTQPEGALVF